MYGKALFGMVLVVVAAVLPYILADDDWLAKLEIWAGQGTAIESQTLEATPVPSVGKETTTGKPVQSLSQVPYSDTSTKQVSLKKQPEWARLSQQLPTNGATVPLLHLLSFDITQDWLRENWRRISTRMGELDLQGWRVAYSRQSPTDDFAGSLTYFFDRQRRVQRIVLHGYTSNPAETVQLATTHFRMQRIPDPVNDLYVAVLDRQTLGGLYCAYAPLLNAKSANEQCEITLELNRQRTEYGMSYEFNQLLDKSRQANDLLTPVGPGFVSEGM